MEWTADTAAIGRWIKKYRYVCLILLVGILFLLFPDESWEPDAATAYPAEAEKEKEGLQEQLTQLLSHLEGAGKVQVLLTEAAGSQTHYETIQDRSRDGTSEELRTETVILTGSDRTESGLVRRVDPPTYLGAVVLCQGADRASVRLAIVDAVSAATGLGADKISVLKMK